MIPLEPVILVEGKYDQIKLSGIFDGVILTTEGFGIFKQPEKRALLRRLTRERGILIFTDSDGAGFVIRSYLKGILSEGRVYHAYLPDIYGKEKRKAHASREGKLGVEGVPAEIIVEAVRKSGALDTQPVCRETITKADLYALGLSGGKNSAAKRTALLQELELPEHLTGNALLQVLNSISDLESLQALTLRLWGETPEEE